MNSALSIGFGLAYSIGLRHYLEHSFDWLLQPEVPRSEAFRKR